MIDPWIIAFYALIIALVIIYRKKFEFHARIGFGKFKFPIVALLKTKIGLGAMDYIGSHLRGLVIFFGYLSIVLGFAGMLLIVGFIGYGLYALIFVPGAPPVISPVIPGVQIPGTGINIPFWQGIIAILVVAAIHEFMHGVVSRAHKIPVRSSGLAIFGPIFGAFVEPDEKKLQKAKKKVQISIFAAGPAINIITAFIFFGLLVALQPGVMNYTNPTGVSFQTIVEDSPAAAVGLIANTTYIKINGKEFLEYKDLQNAMNNTKAGDLLILESNSTVYTVTLGEKEGKTWLGVQGIIEHRDLKNQADKTKYAVAFWFLELLEWLYIISLGIGLANLIPLGPIDGGRMLQPVLVASFGKKKGAEIWARLAIILLILLLILLFTPILRTIIA
jgi:Zn-dependent protease